MRASTALLFGVGLVAVAPALEAQEPELVTDRPDQTESAVTVQKGRVQIESGVLFANDDEGSVSIEVTEVLSTLVRIGLTDRFELRVGADGFVSQRVELGSGRRFRNEGLGDASIGGKLLLWEENPNRPQTALLFETSVPVGESELTSDRFDPAVRLAMSREFDSLSLGWNVGVDFPDDEEIVFYTVAAGFSLSDTRGAFVEIFGDSDSSHSLDAGLTFLTRPNLQFDVAAGVGISDDAPDWFAGIGVSYRR